MAYNLIITEHADELLDELVYYLLCEFKSVQAARHLLDSIEKLYERIEMNPYHFPECRDSYLNRIGYREAVVPDMNYLVIFRVEDKTVYVVGIFHSLENYKQKL
jgi:plasmid stabilization system protein ParE